MLKKRILNNQKHTQTELQEQKLEEYEREKTKTHTNLYTQL